MEKKKKTTQLCKIDTKERRIEKDEFIQGLIELSELAYLLQANLERMNDFDGEESESALYNVSSALADLNIMFSNIFQQFTFIEDHFRKEAVQA